MEEELYKQSGETFVAMHAWHSVLLWLTGILHEYIFCLGEKYSCCFLYYFEENGPSERNFMTIDIIISTFVMRWLRRNPMHNLLS